MDSTTIVIGSGLAGSLAAHELVESGIDTLLIDVSREDRRKNEIPDASFLEQFLDEQSAIQTFLGDDQTTPFWSQDVKVGAQLTPARQYVSKGTEEHLPYQARHFQFMQSLALGGLGSAWGLACFTLTKEELEKAQIYSPHFHKYYEKVANIIGISGNHQDSVSDLPIDTRCFQPPLPRDENIDSIWNKYQKIKNNEKIILSPHRMALLSQPLGERKENPMHNMDFYSKSGESHFRPEYLINSLLKIHSNNFSHKKGYLVLKIDSKSDHVIVHAKNLVDGSIKKFSSKKVVLAAGAVNSARIVANSLSEGQMTSQILTNAYRYLACINLSKFGKSVHPKKHSLAQLFGYVGSEATLQFYSYDSLLLFKLAKEMPLPPKIGFLVSRLLISSLTIVGAFFENRFSEATKLEFSPLRNNELPVARFYDGNVTDEEMKVTPVLSQVKKMLWKLGVVPLQIINPGTGSSIHYAGTLGTQYFNRLNSHCLSSELKGLTNVYVADSAGFQHLSSQGLSFTIMANAIRCAQEVKEGISQ